jgi:hypothetical protein
MRMLKTKVRPIATGAKWAGRPATAVLAYLARMGISPSCMRRAADARGVRLTPSHAIKKGRRYHYYVSAALSIEAGTDRAQGRRIVPRVLGPRPDRLSIGGAGLCPPDPLIRLRIAASSNADVLESDGDRLAFRNYLYPYARVIARALAARVAEGFWVRSAPDAPVEERGFQPPVPPAIE